MKKTLLGILVLIVVCAAIAKVLPSAPTDGDEHFVPACSISADTLLKQSEMTMSDTGAAVNAPSAGAQAANTSSTLPEEMAIPRYESPRGGQNIRHKGYTLSYDADFKTPQWVGWTLTDIEAQGEVPRAKDFLPDPQVHGAKAYTSDYKNSGYDRGHMAPAGDMKWSASAMAESFYMTNICPQNRNLNRGDWKELEELERTWAIRYGAVSITAGPIYTSKSPERIGGNKVAVPDAFFKVLLIGYPDAPKAYAFLFKNEAGSRKLESYQLSVNELEEKTKMDFFPGLSEDVEAKCPAIVR